jgi:hypothetical protein
MSGHTTGPWEVEVDKSGEVTVYEAVTRENIDICTMGGNTNDGRNARLIAAAPELLNALKLALAALDGEVDNAPISPAVARSAQAWMRAKFGDAARAAIAKAEGA